MCMHIPGYIFYIIPSRGYPLKTRQHTLSESPQPINIIQVKPLQYQFFYACIGIDFYLLKQHIWSPDNLMLPGGKFFDHLV